MTVLRPRSPRLVVLLAICVTSLLVLRQLWTTDLGMDERKDGAARVVTEVDAHGPAERAGIAVGDVIVRDPGLVTYVEPYTERELYAWNYRLKRAVERGRVPVTIARGGIEREVEIRPLPAPSFAAGLRQLRRLAPYLPTCFAFLAVAALLVSRRRARAETSEGADRARSVLAMCFACFGPCWVITWPSPGWPLWLFVASSVLDVFVAPLASALLAYFSWTYPAKAAWVDRRRVRCAVLAVGASTSLFSFASALSLFEGPAMLRGNVTSIAFDSVMCFTALTGLVWQRRRAADVVARRQVSWLLGAVTLGTLPTILLLIVPQYALGTVSPMMHYVAFQFPMILPLATAAVVARYRLFALEGFASRLGPYAIATVTSLVVCITVTAAIQMVLGWRSGTTGEASRWAGVVTAIVIGEPLRRLSQRLVDRLFSRDRDALLRRCAELSAKLARAKAPAEMEAMLAAGLDVRMATLKNLEAMFPGEASARLDARLSEAGLLRTWEIRDAAVMDALFARDVELLLSVPSDTWPEGGGRWALLLSSAAFSPWIGRAERDALASLGLVAGAALAQLGIQRTLDAERLRAENERRHIAMELHDGLGAALTAARLMTRRLLEPTGATDTLTLEALDAALQRGLGDLRTSLWSLDAPEGSWEELLGKLRRAASDMCAAAGVAFSMTDVGTNDGHLSPATRLALLRSVQEAVTNAVKHAEPSHVRLDVRASRDRVEVAVENDGRTMLGSTPSGYGLANMSRRIQSLAGTVHFKPREGGGTRVLIGVPLPARDRARAPSAAPS